MDDVRLGQTGLKVSRLCLGCMSYGTPEWRPWVLDEALAAVLPRAIEAGINFFDTADMYSLGVSEEVVGRALKEWRGATRSCIATKVFFPPSDNPNVGGLSRKHILEAFDACSSGSASTTSTSTRSTASTRHADRGDARGARRRGQGRQGPLSRRVSMFAWQFAKLLYTSDLHGWTRFVTMQNHYNLIYREEEREMMPLCREEGIGLIPWSPLARGSSPVTGSAAGKRRRAREAHDRFRPRPVLRGRRLRRRRPGYGGGPRQGVRPIQVALAWILGGRA